jgi:hypothetical protein
MMNNYVIELEHVTVYYRELVALEDVTLLKTILGLVSPVAGAVRLFGEPPRAVQF